MTFEEIRARLANRDAIREKQEQEERAEEEREIEEAARQRREQREQRDAQQKASKLQQQQQQIVAAVADTSSAESADKKYKDKFRKETSEVVVRILDPYHRGVTPTGKIKNKDDFKHLAKKVRKNLIHRYHSSVEISRFFCHSDFA